MSSKHVTLEEYVYKKLKGGVSKYIVLRDLWRSIQERKLKLKDPDPPITLISYVFRLDYTLWFWTSVTLVALTLGLVYVTEYIPLFISARYVLGTIYVLFLPGYSLIEALYPREEDLTPLERVALSIGLSLAVVPLIGLILNYTPWGIRLPSIISSTAAFIIAMLIIALHRKFNFIKLVIINRGLLESRYKR
ncbi:MAG: DUF1616 domain-containing protein [Desulfurococcaceae archaeon]